jgi:peptidoglycan/LPS O-acetylase OafA/YrhL
MHKLAYNPTLDVLRAISVLAVLLYHYFPTLVPKGYVGVDVFFVISGYLQFLIITKCVNENKFSYIEYVNYRIARLLPSLILVLGFVSICSNFLLFYAENLNIAESVLASSLFFENLLLLDSSGYFDSTSETKPLLHLWSLGVEFQYYILGSLLVWLSVKYKIYRWTIPVFLCISLFIFFFFLENYPNKVAFYFPISRFWELFAGACAGFVTVKSDSIFKKYIVVLLFSLICLNSFGFFYVDSYLVNVVSAVSLATLFILLINESGCNALNYRALVCVGLVSYPIYIFHWPLVSFYHIIYGEPPPVSILIFFLFVTVFISAVYYKYVERALIKFLKKKYYATAAFLLLATICAAQYYLIHKIKPTGLAEEFGSYQRFNQKTEELYWSGKCFNLYSASNFFVDNKCVQHGVSKGKELVYLIGDSHAAYLSEGLLPKLHDIGINAYLLSYAFCRPLSLDNSNERCRDIANFINDKISAERPDTIVFFANHIMHATLNTHIEASAYADYIERLVIRLNGLGVERVIVLGQVPTFSMGLPKVVGRFLQSTNNTPDRISLGINPASIEMNHAMNVDLGKSNFYYSMHDLLCNKDGCMTFVNDKRDVASLIYFDYGHLSLAGADYVSDKLIDKYFK